MLTNYKARCHCGRIRFSFRAGPITTGKRCNCSICVRKGAVMSSEYFPAEDFQPHADMDDFIAYQWNDRVIDHLFCKTCGIYPYHGNTEYGYRVNLGCVENLDVFSLDISLIDGKSMAVTESPFEEDVS
ncbi:MAG: GFA family protein [Myxococcota bacterium]